MCRRDYFCRAGSSRLACRRAAASRSARECRASRRCRNRKTRSRSRSLPGCSPPAPDRRKLPTRSVPPGAPRPQTSRPTACRTTSSAAAPSHCAKPCLGRSLRELEFLQREMREIDAVKSSRSGPIAIETDYLNFLRRFYPSFRVLPPRRRSNLRQPRPNLHRRLVPVRPRVVRNESQLDGLILRPILLVLRVERVARVRILDQLALVLQHHHAAQQIRLELGFESV